MKATTKQNVLNLLEKNNVKLQKFGVKRIGVFGSFVKNEQDEYSDVDMVVEFNKGKKNFKNFMGTADLAENILGRKIDMLTPKSMSPYIGPHIKKDIEYVQVT